MDNYIDKIIEAKFEAIKHGISANAVAVSKDLYFSTFPTSGTPMICGLKAIFTEELPDNTAFAVLELPKVASEIPTADVTEVKRGKWEICCDGYYPYCSVCKAEPKNGVMSNYCPNCGVDMRPLDKKLDNN